MELCVSGGCLQNRSLNLGESCAIRVSLAMSCVALHGCRCTKGTLVKVDSSNAFRCCKLR
eukprot:2811581-Pleurochrysis_carterae.AAC.1